MGGDTTTPTIGTGDDPFGLVGACLEGKYDIQAVVAEGGFGVVYRGVHRSLHKTIAVKVLKVPEGLSDALRKEFLGKFAQEARTIAQFEHPAIVRVIDFGASPMPVGEAAPWMVLEWLQGSTLEDDLDRRRGHGRSPSEVLAVLRPIFEALTYAHDEGIAHRDIKPGNIMLVANRRGEVSAKLLDFGIAKFMSQGEHASAGMTATRSALPAFSPLYAAPEQLAGSRTGPWTDVHAMALVVSEAMVGGPVYPQDDNTALYAAVLAPTRPTPGRFGVDAGPWEPVLQRALAVRPDHRYGHMREFLADLHAGVEAASHLPRAPSTSGSSIHPSGRDSTSPAEQPSEGPTAATEAVQAVSPHLLGVAPTGLAMVPSTLQPVTQSTEPILPAPQVPRLVWAISGALMATILIAGIVLNRGETTAPRSVHVGGAPTVPEAPHRPPVSPTPPADETPGIIPPSPIVAVPASPAPPTAPETSQGTRPSVPARRVGVGARAATNTPTHPRQPIRPPSRVTAPPTTPAPAVVPSPPPARSALHHSEIPLL